MIDPIRQPFHALTLQPHRRAEPRAARGAFGRCVRGGDDLARARSPRAGRRGDTFGARAREALLVIAPRLVPYLMSFLTLGIFWLGQQAQLDRLAKSDRDLAWMHVGFLCVVCLVPFSTALLAEFLTFRAALLVYWVNLLLLGLVLLVTWGHAWRMKLIRDDTTSE